MDDKKTKPILTFTGVASQDAIEASLTAGDPIDVKATRAPSETRRRARVLPMKPMPPVTMTARPR